MFLLDHFIVFFGDPQKSKEKETITTILNGLLQ
jgi:hypothetical protein